MKIFKLSAFVVLFLLGLAFAAGAQTRRICPGNSCHTSPVTTTAPATTTVPTTTYTPTTTTVPSPTSAGPLGPSGSWRLVFGDDFTKDSNLGAAWVNRGWGSGCSIGFDSTNGMTFHLSNSADGNGCEIMSAAKYLYGAYQAVVSVPSRPANCFNGYAKCAADHAGWWTAGDSWPADGEFDIVEQGGGYQPTWFIHSSAGQVGGSVIQPNDWLDSFHTYTVEWAPNPDAAHSLITLWWDGVQVGQTTQALTTNGQHLRANLYVCASGCGETGYAPADMHVRSIKAWQR